MRAIFRRGQEEAPIELLIAVAVLTFVLIIGFYAYNNACAAQFEHQMRSSLSGFARALEQIYQGGVGTSYPIVVDFSPIGCASGDIDSVRMVKGDEQFCNVRLGVSECFMLAIKIKEKFLNEELFIAESVNIPYSTTGVYYYLNPEKEQECIISDFETRTDFDDPLKEQCGWRMQRNLLTLKKTSRGIEIIRG